MGPRVGIGSECLYKNGKDPSHTGYHKPQVSDIGKFYRILIYTGPIWIGVRSMIEIGKFIPTIIGGLLWLKRLHLQ